VCVYLSVDGKTNAKGYLVTNDGVRLLRIKIKLYVLVQGGTQLGAPHQVEQLGRTFVPFQIFIDYLQGLATSNYTLVFMGSLVKQKISLVSTEVNWISLKTLVITKIYNFILCTVKVINMYTPQVATKCNHRNYHKYGNMQNSKKYVYNNSNISW
jgi:hypothetical protein